MNSGNDFNPAAVPLFPQVPKHERELTQLNRELANRLAILSELLTRAISGRRIEEQYYREFGGEG